jgi:hypothetical protein
VFLELQVEDELETTRGLEVGNCWIVLFNGTDELWKLGFLNWSSTEMEYGSVSEISDVGERENKFDFWWR